MDETPEGASSLSSSATRKSVENHKKPDVVQCSNLVPNFESHSETDKDKLAVNQLEVAESDVTQRRLSQGDEPLWLGKDNEDNQYMLLGRIQQNKRKIRMTEVAPLYSTIREVQNGQSSALFSQVTHSLRTCLTVKNSTDPVFKERFLFTVEPEQLMGKSLQLQVFSIDKYARQKVIGEADVRIGDIDLNMPIKMWFNLRDIDEKPTEHGDILFSLSYLPTAERLTVVIVKARSLRWRSGKDSGDPFVKVYLLQNGKKISKKKTSVKRGEKNPIFNEAMIFSVPASALSTVQLRITVAEYLSENKTPSLGHVIVGAHTSGTESTHWNQMMTSLRKPVAMWHFLRK